MDEGKNGHKKGKSSAGSESASKRTFPAVALETRAGGGDTTRSAGSTNEKTRRETAAGAQTETLMKQGGFSHSGTERANQEAAPQRRAGSEKHMRLEHTYTHIHVA